MRFGMPLMGVENPVRRRIRFVDADHQGPVILKTGDQRIGQSPVTTEDDANGPWPGNAVQNRREAMDGDKRCRSPSCEAVLDQPAERGMKRFMDSGDPCPALLLADVIAGNGD